MNKSVKKAAALVLGAVLMLASCAEKPAKGENVTLFTAQKPEHIALDTVTSENGINCFTIISDSGAAMIEFPYIGIGGHFRFVTVENGAVTRERELPDQLGITSMIFDEERRRYYAYDSISRAVYSFDEEFENPSELLKADALGCDASDFSIRSMELLDGKLYIIHTNKNPYSPDNVRGENGYADLGEQVRVIDPESKSCELLGIPNPICSFCDGEELYFYTCENGVYELKKYDRAKNRLIKLYDMDDAGYAVAFVLYENKFIYSKENSSDIFQKNLETGIITSYVNGSYVLFGMDMRLYKGNLIYLDRMTMSIRKMFMGEEEAYGNEGMEYSGTELVISGNPQGNKVDFSALKADTGITASLYDFPIYEDEMLLKIMAGDSDIDIYTLYSSRSVGNGVRRNGIYIPLNDCEEVKSYLAGCHDFISDYAVTESGDIWAMPAVLSVEAIFYVPENIEKLGLDYENNFMMYSDYIDTMTFMKTQNEFIHCGNGYTGFTMENTYDLNYSSGGYRNDIFKNYFSKTWDGWIRADELNHPCPYYGNYWNIGGSNFDTEKIAFKTDYIERQITGDDLFEGGKADGFYKWRAFPMPKLASENEKQAAVISYFVINPYSNNTEAAKYYLNTIASDHMRYIGGFSPVFKDIEKYSAKYDINEPLFRDVYEIMLNAGVYEPVIKVDNREYIDDYQQGRMTLDEVAEYLERQTEMALNE